VGYRYTEIKITPTFQSLGFNDLKGDDLTTFNKMVNSLLEQGVSYETLEAELMRAGNASDALTSAFRYFDPDYDAPKALTLNLNTGKFKDNTETEWIYGLDINFDLETRGVGSKSQKGIITVWNLGYTALNIVSAGADIVLRSGYNIRYDTIFSGTILEVITEREDNDKKTTIKVIGAVVEFKNYKHGQYIAYGRDNFKQSITNWLTATTTSHLAGAGQTHYFNAPGVASFGLQIEFVGWGDDTWARELNKRTGGYVNTISEYGTTITEGPYIDTTILFNQVDGTTYNDTFDMLEEKYDIKIMFLNRKIYIINGDTPLPLSIRLTYYSGLISFNRTPKTDDTDYTLTNEYTVRSILLPDIFPKALVAIQPSLSDVGYQYTENGIELTQEYYIVTEAVYKSTDDEHVCEFKCVPASDFEEASNYITNVVNDLIDDELAMEEEELP
jgi:hypothetical protein